MGRVMWGHVESGGRVGPGVGWARILWGPGLGVPGQAHLPCPTPGALAVAVKDSSHLCSEGVGGRRPPGWAPAGPWSARPRRGRRLCCGFAFQLGRQKHRPELRPQGPDGWRQPGRPAWSCRWSAPGPRRPERGRGDGRGRGHQSSLPGTRAWWPSRLPAWGSGGTEAALQSRGPSPSQH